MKTSEFEYYLLCELITMPDRDLAHKIELHIWNDQPHPDGEVLQKYIDAIRNSEDDRDFSDLAREIVKTHTTGQRLATQEQLFEDELQEGIKADLLSYKVEFSFEGTPLGEAIIIDRSTLPDGLGQCYRLTVTKIYNSSTQYMGYLQNLIDSQTGHIKCIESEIKKITE
jgi:hypothetical protein